ncbi:hypothetical protein FHG87_014830 [Trinorchestia longiramus]|nr:hypothetical protein FHG87_014830 [Trinorchestia longiramus]
MVEVYNHAHDSSTTTTTTPPQPRHRHNHAKPQPNAGPRSKSKFVPNFVALADTVSKIFCGILNERMKHVVEEQGVMGEEHNGFRRDRRGEDNLFVVSEVIERKRKENKKVYLAFLDIEKAYDRVDRRRCKALSVNRHTWRWNEGNTRLCLQCNRGVEETVEHLVLECSKYEQERESLMDVVHEQCGENKWNARHVEEDSGIRYLAGLYEECNMTVVDAMKDFLVYALNKRQGC